MRPCAVSLMCLALALPAGAVPPDGEGTAEFRCSAKPIVGGTWKADLVFTVGKSGIKEGGGIRFRTPPTAWAAPHVADLHFRFQTRSGAKPVWKTGEEGVLGTVITVVARGGELAPGDRIIYTYETGRVQRYTQNGLACRLESDATGDGRFALLDQDRWPRIDVASGPPAQVRLAARQVVKPGSRIVVRSIILDADRNPADAVHTGDVLVGFAGSETVHRFEKNRASFTLAAPTEPGIHHIHAGGPGLAETYLPVKVTDENCPNIYWGQLHGHTAFSDGVETPDDYYAYGRDVGFLDVCATNDHAEHKNAEDRWTRTITAARDHYKPGEFVTLVGYEWTAEGHRNVYFAETTGDLPLIWGRDETTPSYWDLVKKLKASGKEVVIGYHTAHPTDLANYDPDLQRLEELHSMWGTSEYPGNPGWTKSNDPYVPMSSAQSALARGQRLGFVGGGDSHHGRPGRCWYGTRWWIMGHKEGIAAILAPRLERRDIFDAMKARHTYAATGERILLDFRVNGHVMGDELDADGPVEIKIDAGGTGDIEKVEIVRDNAVIWARYGKGMLFSETITDDSLTPGCHFYYLRLTQRSGDRAWSSPVWVHRK